MSARPEYEFLSAGGEMGARIRDFDWSGTAIGTPDTWSTALRTLVRMLLANRFPLLLWWGPEYISIYNDAYRPILGQKHPWGLGRPVRECWSEIWDVLKPLIDTPFHGGPATWLEDIELQLNRAGFSEETHFTVAYSPVPDETVRGGIGGVLATVHEITEKVIGERRGMILRDLGNRAAEAKTAEEACVTAAATLAKYAKDVPFALIYLADSDGTGLKLAASCGVEQTTEVEQCAAWPFSEAHRSEEMQVVTNLGRIFATLPAGTWPEPPNTAVVLPVRANIAHRLAGFLVAGLSSHRKLDDAYRNFLDLATTQVATAIANARAYETERKRAEALAEIDRAKTAFFSNVSHEFRTPLTLMLGPLESVLSKESALSAEDRQQLQTAHRNSLRLMKLVNSLLDFSRIEAGRVKAAYSPVDLSAVTADLASNFRSTMEAAGLELIVDCPPLPQRVFVDHDMWEKIVLNLLSNAFKFTFAGSVTVRVTARENNAILTVTDTGVGVPEKEVPHIFERFHRVEGTRGRTYEGTGIGLALIQELVKLHGGTVKVDSREGAGSTFTVAIPFGSAHLAAERIELSGTAHRSTSARAEAFTGEAQTWIAEKHQLSSVDVLANPLPAGAAAVRRRILLADDNADMRQYIQKILGNQYEIIAVSDGYQALDQAKKIYPDLVLSDVMMPKLDGFGLLRELRSQPELREIPVILLSARAGEEARTEGIAAGADEYLTKPFNGRELAVRVQTILDLQRVRRESREQFETLFNQSPIGVYLVDSNFRIRQVNPAAAPVFANIPDVIGRDFKEVIHILWPKAYADEIVELFRHTMETGEPYVTPERVEQRLDRGVKEYYEWRIDRILLPDGFGVVCYFREISEQVRARETLKTSEEELRRANQDLEQFAHSASHDLQEPLRSVKICSELLGRRYQSRLDAQGVEILEFIRSGASRMETLIRDLLAYTRAAKLEKPAEMTSSLESVRTVLASLAGTISATGARINIGELPPVEIHDAHLQQVFQNLISNALKYCRPGVIPEIHIAAKRDGGSWLFTVADNGIGIESQFKERIFGLFKRLHTQEEYPGSGIGLAICQRIVERYHGRIWVESEPGRGSEFNFTLPA